MQIYASIPTAPRVVEAAKPTARDTKTALAKAKAVFVAGAVRIELTTRGFGVDVEDQTDA